MGVNRHPFVKDKWDERAYFLVQDVLYEGMDDGHVSVNAGISDLVILAFIRATCSRPGALSKDWFDMSGAIAKWARVGGENVMSVSALTFSRDGSRSLPWTHGLPCVGSRLVASSVTSWHEPRAAPFSKTDMSQVDMSRRLRSEVSRCGP